MERTSHTKVATVICSVALGAVVACGIALPESPAYAVTAAEKEAEAQATLQQLNAMQGTLEEASNRYYQALSEYAEAETKCDSAQKRINEISGEIADIQSRLGDRARDMYRNGSVSFIDLLLGSASFDELATNWDLLTRLNTTDAELSMKAKELREETEAKKAEYTEQAAVAQEKSNEAQEAYNEAQTVVAQMEETFNSLSEEARILYQQEQAALYTAAAAQAAGGQAAGGDGGAYVEYTDAGYVNDDGTVTDIATGETYSSAAEYSAATGNAVVDRAYAMLGHSYKWGGTGADGSFDCSGLVGYALTGSYERIGNTITYMGYQQVSDPQPGDIAVNADHTGIYIGDGQMIHAADENTGVVKGAVQDGMIYVRYNG